MEIRSTTARPAAPPTTPPAMVPAGGVLLLLLLLVPLIAVVLLLELAAVGVEWAVPYPAPPAEETCGVPATATVELALVVTASTFALVVIGLDIDTSEDWLDVSDSDMNKLDDEASEDCELNC